MLSAVTSQEEVCRWNPRAGIAELQYKHLPPQKSPKPVEGYRKCIGSTCDRYFFLFYFFCQIKDYPAFCVTVGRCMWKCVVCPSRVSSSAKKLENVQRVTVSLPDANWQINEFIELTKTFTSNNLCTKYNLLPFKISMKNSEILFNLSN